MKNRGFAALLVSLLLTLPQVAIASDSAVPEPFRGYDANSTYSINYSDLDALYANAVLVMGRSSREKAAPTQAATGTRMKEKTNRSSAAEANRFNFEAFQDNDDDHMLLRTIRDSLASVPGEVGLAYFNRDEQLAYWINLYNITLLTELVEAYPQRNLKKLLTGPNSIQSRKLLTVAGIPLSLDDIQFTILRVNYENDPLVLYGLYQGIIGGPNIRSKAYTGENVFRFLRDNAVEFVNSNRGTLAQNATTFRASSLYERNQSYFPDFQSDLRRHLEQYLQGKEKAELATASTIKANIDDWTITDVFGSHQRIAGSMATNSAAMIDAVQNTTVVNIEGSGPTLARATNANYSTSLAARAQLSNRISPEMQEFVNTVKQQEEKQAASKTGTVTLEEVEDVPAELEENDQP